MGYAKSVNGNDTPENENPGALAGATGAYVQIGQIEDQDTLNRLLAARALADAATACAADDRVPLLERLLDTLRPGWPIPAFMGRVMSEAEFWADMASRAELKAYALACWQRMPTEDREGFIRYVARSAA